MRALICLLTGCLRSGKRITANGYVVITSVSGEEKLEHRIVAEKVLRRPLGGGDVVHHINGRPGDNRPKNLCVMPGTDHERYHDWYDWIVSEYGSYPKRETRNAVAQAQRRFQWNTAI